LNNLRLEAETTLPTKWGTFKLKGYGDPDNNTEHIAIISENFNPLKTPILRVHSECITGEAFGSLKCECGPQLDEALRIISNENGLVIYMRGQEGRGIGLLNKLKAYSLQEKGLDTVEANIALGLPEEARDFEAAVEILKDLGVKSVKMLTNNPRKIEFLEKGGIIMDERLPLVIGLNETNKDYMSTKNIKMGHIL
jgi:3,4-dihydroxy 2-butanone 4-phosphate synthase / GTP cyclohydrolase II